MNRVGYGILALVANRRHVQRDDRILGAGRSAATRRPDHRALLQRTGSPIQGREAIAGPIVMLRRAGVASRRRHAHSQRV
jgi:hypothetical protein